eukprot:sb/3478104/
MLGLQSILHQQLYLISLTHSPKSWVLNTGTFGNRQVSKSYSPAGASSTSSPFGCNSLPSDSLCSGGPSDLNEYNCLESLCSQIAECALAGKKLGYKNKVEGFN